MGTEAVISRASSAFFDFLSSTVEFFFNLTVRFAPTMLGLGGGPLLIPDFQDQVKLPREQLPIRKPFPIEAMYWFLWCLLSGVSRNAVSGCTEDRRD